MKFQLLWSHVASIHLRRQFSKILMNMSETKLTFQ